MAKVLRFFCKKGTALATTFVLGCRKRQMDDKNHRRIVSRKISGDSKSGRQKSK